MHPDRPKRSLITKDEEFRNIFHVNPAAMLVVDVDDPSYTVLDANDAYLSATNGKRGELIGQPLFKVFPENEVESVSGGAEKPIDSFRKAIATGQPQRMSDYRYDILIQETGRFEERYWTTINTPVLDEHGKVKYLVHSPIDVTELHFLSLREQAGLQQIAESEQLLKDITSATPTGLWTTDEMGEITYVNQTWIDWTGRPLEEHLKRGWLSSILEEDREHVRKELLKALDSSSLYEVEARLLHADGTVHWCVATGMPKYNHEGYFKGYVGAWIDITDIKRLQRQKDDFLGIASHELKTPVTSMKGYVQVLEHMLLAEGNTHAAALVGKMDRQVNRLTSLIGDLLDVTKMATGKLQFNDRSFDLKVLVEESIDELQPSVLRHKLIKELSGTTNVFGDRERIAQVITNLITNAVKYSPDADKVVIKMQTLNNEVVISVQDFGIGIAAADLEKVFKQFYRVEGDRQSTYPGLGLGLFICSEILKRQGGRIWANSTEGEGSVFYFSLPIVDC